MKLPKNLVVPVFTAALIFLVGCGRINKEGIENLNNGNIEVIGHAGSGFLYPILPFNSLPPNSKGSIEKALFENNADGVEVDIQMSSDSVLILFHDSDLSVMDDLSGCISSVESRNLIGKKYNTGPIYGLFHDEEIISFEALLSWFISLDQFPKLYLDVKNFDNCLKGDQHQRAVVMASKLHSIIVKFNLPLEQMVIGSSDRNLLMQLKKLNNDYSLMLDENVDFERGMEWVMQNQMQGLIIGARIADKQKIKAAHKNGLYVVVFGGRSRSSIIEIVQKYPDAIQVNNVKQLKALLH